LNEAATRGRGTAGNSVGPGFFVRKQLLGLCRNGVCVVLPEVSRCRCGLRTLSERVIAKRSRGVGAEDAGDDI
jgi:hypothetical protein